jgi:hypothetical protein
VWISYAETSSELVCIVWCILDDCNGRTETVDILQDCPGIATREGGWWGVRGVVVKVMLMIGRGGEDPNNLCRNDGYVSDDICYDRWLKIVDSAD